MLLGKLGEFQENISYVVLTFLSKICLEHCIIFITEIFHLQCGLCLRQAVAVAHHNTVILPLFDFRQDLVGRHVCSRLVLLALCIYLLEQYCFMMMFKNH